MSASALPRSVAEGFDIRDWGHYTAVVSSATLRMKRERPINDKTSQIDGRLTSKILLLHCFFFVSANSFAVHRRAVRLCEGLWSRSS